MYNDELEMGIKKRISFVQTSEIETMAAILALGGSPSGMRREAEMSRTVPVTPIAHSSPESMHGRNVMHVPRSHSAPKLLEAGDAHGTLPTLDFTPAVVEAGDLTALIKQLNVDKTKISKHGK
ncbi:hypothetical protein Tco_0041035 [Tanacetum coccineum]